MALEGPKALDTHVFATNMFQELGVDTPRLDNIMIDQVNNCIDAFGKQTGPFEPGKYIYAAKVNVMSAIIFGRTLEYLGPEFTALTKEVFRMLDAVGGGIIQQLSLAIKSFSGKPSFRTFSVQSLLIAGTLVVNRCFLVGIRFCGIFLVLRKLVGTRPRIRFGKVSVCLRGNWTSMSGLIRSAFSVTL